MKDFASNRALYITKIIIEVQFWSKKPSAPGIDLSSRVAIVLGAKAARQLFVMRMLRFVMAARSAPKGEAPAESLRKDFAAADVTVLLLDMSSYDSIQSLAQRAREQLTRLDIVILNAGIMKLKFTTDPSMGHEGMVQVNYLSTMLLALLMLPVLGQKSAGRAESRAPARERQCHDDSCSKRSRTELISLAHLSVDSAEKSSSYP